MPERHEFAVEPHWQAHGVILHCSCGKLRQRIGHMGMGGKFPLADLVDAATTHIQDVNPLYQMQVAAPVITQEQWDRRVNKDAIPGDPKYRT
jgi:hypothetical protein